MNLFGLKQEEVEALKNCFSHYTAIQNVILYGSRAKGNFKKSSDIDLAIVDNHLTSSDFAGLENQLDDLMLPYKIDLSLKRNMNNPALLDHIDRVGIEFYKKKPDF